LIDCVQVFHWKYNSGVHSDIKLDVDVQYWNVGSRCRVAVWRVCQQ